MSTATGRRLPPFDLSGTPLILTFRRILEECTTVAEAEKLLRSVKRTTLMNLAVCDAAGTGVVFELTPKSVSVRKADERDLLLHQPFPHGRSGDRHAVRSVRRADQGQRATPKLGLTDVQERLHAANQGAGTMQTMIFEPADSDTPPGHRRRPDDGQAAR